MTNFRTWTALFDYAADGQSNQISLTVGNSYQILHDPEPSGWVHVRDPKTDKQGYAPESYFQKSPPPQSAHLSTSLQNHDRETTSLTRPSQKGPLAVFHFLNLPDDVTKDEIIALCRKDSEVTDVQLFPKDRFHTSTGAKVTLFPFGSEQLFLEKVKMYHLRGHTPTVTLIRMPKSKDNPQRASGGPSHQTASSIEYSPTKILLKPLPDSVKESEVRTAFRGFSITSYEEKRNKDKRGSKVAYIDFIHTDMQERALKMDGKLILGGVKQNVYVAYAAKSHNAKKPKINPAQPKLKANEQPKEDRFHHVPQPVSSQNNHTAQTTLSHPQHTPHNDVPIIQRYELLVKNIPPSVSIKMLADFFSSLKVEEIRFLQKVDVDGAKSAIISLSDPNERQTALQFGERMQLGGVRQVVSIWTEPSQSPSPPPNAPQRPPPPKEPPQHTLPTVQHPPQPPIYQSSAFASTPQATLDAPTNRPLSNLTQFLSPLPNAAPRASTQFVLPPPPPNTQAPASYTVQPTPAGPSSAGIPPVPPFPNRNRFTSVPQMPAQPQSSHQVANVSFAHLPPPPIPPPHSQPHAASFHSGLYPSGNPVAGSQFPHFAPPQPSPPQPPSYLHSQFASPASPSPPSFPPQVPNPTAPSYSAQPHPGNHDWGTCPLSNKKIVSPGWIKGMEDVIYDYDALTNFVKENGINPSTFEPMQLNQICHS
ncbi:hypothetical protein BLNAU_10640 [Blattamonas nauphoetae]|uniref:Uncharacterized protein n=1 Tax=Blattamonas nauphoetae TaxID=2049346 RepID=A0ABQ9XPW3_9EUKA|nr:hypothetical protein BLNAU_10640 [Blattamonas nauphoetae]